MPAAPTYGVSPEALALSHRARPGPKVLAPAVGPRAGRGGDAPVRQATAPGPRHGVLASYRSRISAITPNAAAVSGTASSNPRIPATVPPP